MPRIGYRSADAIKTMTPINFVLAPTDVPATPVHTVGVGVSSENYHYTMLVNLIGDRYLSNAIKSGDSDKAFLIYLVWLPNAPPSPLLTRWRSNRLHILTSYCPAHAGYLNVPVNSTPLPSRLSNICLLLPCGHPSMNLDFVTLPLYRQYGMVAIRCNRYARSRSIVACHSGVSRVVSQG